MRLAGWHQQNEAFQASADDWTVKVFPGQGRAMVTWDAFSGEANSTPTDGSSQPTATFSVSPHPSHSFLPEEIYVRQTDLIARYAQSEGDQFALQFDWRLVPTQPPFAMALEIWISIQTQLLDTYPKVQLRCAGPGAWTHWSQLELESDLGCVLSHRGAGDSVESQRDPGQLQDPGQVRAACLSTGGQYNLVWLTDPRDQSQLHWLDSNRQDELKAELFGDFLEKGVIRRARMQLLVGSVPALEEHVKRAFRDLDSSALPLTA